MSDFGQVLKRFRTTAGMTQEELGERAGFSAVYISMLERGKRTSVPATVDTLAQALQLSPRDRALLLGTAGPPAPSSPTLIGRAAELTLLDRHVLGEIPPLVAFAGEPGVGKTSLLREAAVRAEQAGYRVLHAGCRRPGHQEPYAPLLGALQSFLRQRTPEQRHTYTAGCGWLVRLLPELASELEPIPSWNLTAAQETRLVVESLGRFLENIGGPSGTMLILDDMQWAESDALDLLSGVLQLGLPLRMVAAYRDTEVQDSTPLATLLYDLARYGLLSHHHVTPLGVEEAAQLLSLVAGNRLTPERQERIIRQTGGLPLFLISYAQAPGEDDLPWDVKQNVQQRVAALSQNTQRVLATAAVAGRHISHSMLQDVLGLDEESVVAALEEASHAGMLIAMPACYRFAHDILREVIEADLGPARRALQHRAIARVLERQTPPPLAELAYHYARSDQPALAVDWLERAGDRALEQRAFTAAASYFRELVARLDEFGPKERRAQASHKLGGCLTTLGLWEEALAALETAATLYRELQDPAAEGLVVAEIGRLHYRRGTPDAGIARLEPLRHRAASGAAINLALAPLYLQRGLYGEQLQAAQRAAEMARAADDSKSLAEAEVWRGCALNQLGDRDNGVQVQEAAIPLAEAVGDLASLTHALNDVAFFLEAVGQFARSYGYKERALALAEQLGDPLVVANMAFRCGQNALLRGDIQAARDFFQHAANLTQELGNSAVSAYPLFGLAQLALIAGDAGEARNYAQDCLVRASAAADLDAVRAATGLLAECDLRDARPLDALRRLESVPAEGGLSLAALEPVRAETHLALGEIAEAQMWARRAVEHARETGHQVRLVEALRVLALAGGSQAGNALTEGLSRARTMGYRIGELRLIEAQTRLAPPAEAEHFRRQARAIRRELGLGVAGSDDDVPVTVGRESMPVATWDA